MIRDSKIEVELNNNIDKNGQRFLPDSSMYSYVSESVDMSFISGREHDNKRLKNFIDIVRTINEVLIEFVFMKNYTYVFPFTKMKMIVKLRKRTHRKNLEGEHVLNVATGRNEVKKDLIRDGYRYRPVLKISAYKTKIENIFKFAPVVSLVSRASKRFYEAIEAGDLSYSNYLKDPKKLKKRASSYKYTD